MTPPLDWKIPEGSDDWQADWKSSRRFQLQYWASLSLREKLMAIEEMGDLAERFQRYREAAMVKEKKPRYDAESGNSSAPPSPGSQ